MGEMIKRSRKVIGACLARTVGPRVSRVLVVPGHVAEGTGGFEISMPGRRSRRDCSRVARPLRSTVVTAVLEVVSACPDVDVIFRRKTGTGRGPVRRVTSAVGAFRRREVHAASSSGRGRGRGRGRRRGSAGCCTTVATSSV